MRERRLALMSSLGTPTKSCIGTILSAEHAQEIEQYVQEHRLAEEDTAGVPKVLKHSEGDRDSA